VEAIISLRYFFNAEGWFIYAGANADPGALYLLESSQPLPESHRPMVLHFHYHMAGARGRLRVCFANSTKGLVPLLLDSANSTIGENRQADSLCPFLREGMAELSELPAEVDPRAWRKAAVSVPLDSNKACANSNNKITFCIISCRFSFWLTSCQRIISLGWILSNC